MNLLIETLNAWAEHALRFAWPMLWQSSLLIGLLFALDLLMRRKVRPAVRYSLWLVVLVKLVLPPSLAVPTSPGWWLRPAITVPAEPRRTTVVVTYGPSESPVFPVAATPVFVAPPRPHLLPAAWAFVGVVAVGVGLLAWMLWRWHQVARDARRAAAAPEWLSELLHEQRGPAQLGRVPTVGAHGNETQRREEQCREKSGEEGAQTNHLSVAHLQVLETGKPLHPSRLCGLMGRSSTARLRLRLTDHPHSPAVCGLIRPVILLPRSLAEQLPPTQLRAVLLHELLHLRRGDVWVNCAQALLQVAYWWHPLLWFANARIRRVREEAVDDAVMLALNEDADSYAPTLLEVAKLALHRPLATLGLVGILESRSSLRQRIERLMDFRPPRRAGLTLVSVLAVFGFAALALPMGEAPAPTEAPQSAGNQVATNSFASDAPASPISLDQEIKTGTLTRDGKLLYEMGKLDEAEAKLKLALKEDPHNETALYYLNLVAEARLQSTGGLRKVPQMPRRELLPVPNPYSRTNLVRTSQGRQAIITKLDRIRLDSVSFDSLPLREVVRSLADEARKRDPEKSGISFLLNQGVDSGFSSPAEVLGSDGNPLPTPPPEQVDMGAITIKINPPLTDIRLADVLDAIVKVADRPIKYSIEDYAIVFSLRGRVTNPLYIRTYKVDPNTVFIGLRAATDHNLTNGPGAIAPALLDLLSKAGVDFDPTRNSGKSLFWNDRMGTLLVRATLQDLDIVEQQIAVLNTPLPQVNIKVKFVEVPQDDTKALGFDWYLGNVLMTNGAVGGQAGTTRENAISPAAINPMGVFPGTPTGLAPTNIAPGSTNQVLSFGLRNTYPSSSTLTGILTDPQFRVVMKALQQRSGAELIAQPEVTTVSGRQAQMKAVDVTTVVTGINKQVLTPPGITVTNEDASSLYVTEQMEFGPVLDVIPSVLADGYTIELMVIPTVTEFLGYEEARTNRVVVYVNGKQKWVNPPLPKFRVRQMNTNVRVWDGQTVVLGGLPSETVNTLKDKVPLLGDLPLVGGLFRSESKSINKKNLLIFVTPTLIDAVGNRIHAEDEIPSARNAVPPQPAR
jgi:type II secretory pathway component GspD/PulD (secretin)/beta-lactamase regulating signal transducer with metallopeptidase domain